MKAKMGIEDKDQKELQKSLQELFKDADNDEEFEKRMNQLENMFTPKREILRKCKKKLYSVLDAHIQGTLTKEKSLLLLQSKYHQLNEEIKDMALKGRFVEIDYEDGKGYIPEEFMKIANEVNYYYNITKNNIEFADVKLENFSNPAVKQVVKSVGASFDKFFGIEKTDGNESQSKQETTASSQNSESPVAKPDTAINLPVNDVLEKLTVQDNPVLRRWNGGKYKCKNLRLFVNRYADTTKGNPTKNLILDYLVKENGEPFRESAIVSTLNSYGVAPERKKATGRQRKGTHKKDFL
jgi:hypothetical protein